MAKVIHELPQQESFSEAKDRNNWKVWETREERGQIPTNYAKPEIALLERAVTMVDNPTDKSDPMILAADPSNPYLGSTTVYVADE